MKKIREMLKKVSKSGHVGDTATDMQLAHNAGVTPVGVLWGYRPLEELQEARAQHIIEHPLELLEIIDF